MTRSNSRDAVIKIKELFGAHDQLIRKGLRVWLQQVWSRNSPACPFPPVAMGRPTRNLLTPSCETFPVNTRAKSVCRHPAIR